MPQKLSTDEKITQAFSKLLVENGYDKTTTKRVAELAQVNEVTIFRHFKNKENILSSIVQQLLKRIENINSTFQASGNLEQDLIHISNQYYKQITQNRTFFLLGLQLVKKNLKLERILSELPQKTRKLALHDFKLMQAAGEISPEVDIKATAMNFLFINYSHFVFKSIYKIGESQTEFAQHNVKAFIRNLN